jgi:hypothetical protein
VTASALELAKYGQLDDPVAGGAGLRGGDQAAVRGTEQRNRSTRSGRQHLDVVICGELTKLVGVEGSQQYLAGRRLGRQRRACLCEEVGQLAHGADRMWKPREGGRLDQYLADLRAGARPAARPVRTWTAKGASQQPAATIPACATASRVRWSRAGRMGALDDEELGEEGVRITVMKWIEPLGDALSALAPVPVTSAPPG